MDALVLDSEALNVVVRARQGTALAALNAAVARGADVIVPAAVLAELYRGTGRTARLDAYLGRVDPPIRVEDTTRPLARRIGGLLAAAGRGSADHVDATVVATAARAVEDAEGCAVILTGDPDDLTALAAGSSRVLVAAL